MAKNDHELRVEAEQKFPGDRARQDAYFKLHVPAPASSTTRKPTSTVKKKKTPARKIAKPIAKRRRF